MEAKIDAIVEETKGEDMRLISGIPSWVQNYFERLLEVTGAANVKEVFPNLELFVYGGVAFEPYRERFRKLIGSDVPTVELFRLRKASLLTKMSCHQKVCGSTSMRDLFRVHTGFRVFR